jgi:hypothetical protein
MKWSILALLLFTQTVAAMPADDWLELVVDLQKHEHKLDKNDRFFLRYMVNWLTADEHAEPTKAQQKWLLDIKRRVMKNADAVRGRT